MTSPALTVWPAFKPSRIAVQMRVKRIDLQALDLVAQDDVVAVIGKRRACVDVGHGAVGGGHDGIGRFAVACRVAGSECRGPREFASRRCARSRTCRCPGFADGADKEVFLAALLEQGAVGRGQLEKFGARAARR